MASTDGKCRALVLSGGSNNGAWEAGVIWGLLHYGNPEDYAWDVVSGISAGSINTGGIATWPTGTELEMTEWLSQQWAETTTDEIWVKRPGNIFDHLFEQPSFLDDDPALATLARITSSQGSIARTFSVSAVDVNTGDFISMTDKDTSFEQLPQAALSSSSINVVFPPQHMNGHVFIDGGYGLAFNLMTAVQQCLEKVEDEKDIIVDVAVCDTIDLPETGVSNSALENHRVANSIKKYNTSTASLTAQVQAYPDITVRNYFQESTSCPGHGGLSFDNSTTWCLQEQGRSDAKAMLEIGSANVAQTFEDWGNTKAIRNEFPHFRDYLNKVYSYIFD